MADVTTSDTLLELTGDLAIAWLSNPNTRIPASEVASLVATIHAALAGISGAGAAPEQAKEEFVPAVSVRQSLASKDHIISLIDGKPYRALKRHLTTRGLTPQQYRERYGLRADYPMVSESYSQVRRDMAKKIGLGRKPGQKMPAKPAKPRARKKLTIAI